MAPRVLWFARREHRVGSARLQPSTGAPVSRPGQFHPRPFSWCPQMASPTFSFPFQPPAFRFFP